MSDSFKPGFFLPTGAILAAAPLGLGPGKAPGRAMPRFSAKEGFLGPAPAKLGMAGADGKWGMDGLPGVLGILKLPGRPPGFATKPGDGDGLDVTAGDDCC